MLLSVIYARQLSFLSQLWGFQNRIEPGGLVSRTLPLLCFIDWSGSCS